MNTGNDSSPTRPSASSWSWKLSSESELGACPVTDGWLYGFVDECVDG